MDLVFFLKGLLTGLLVALPVGPVGVLCAHRTLEKGRIHGLVSGFGAATADASYAFMVAFGVSFVSDFLVAQQSWLKLAGGIFLCGLGVKILFSKRAKEVCPDGDINYLHDYGSAFLLTLMNPVTILAFAAVFAGLGVVTSNRANAGLFVAGAFMGSSFWWITLSATAGVFRDKIGKDELGWLGKVSGSVIVLFGIFVLFSR